MELEVLDALKLEESRHRSRGSQDLEDASENTSLLAEVAPPADPTSNPNSAVSLSSMDPRERVRDINTLTYVLVCMFAVSSWIDINGLWVEIPLLVSELPEGWNLPSYLAVIIQVANIGPIAYTVANRLAPNKVREWPVVYIIITIGAASCLLMAFFWNSTSYIGGHERSTALIAMCGFLALVDCTSSVVYLPYMAGLKPQYMTALYIGEGFSGLIPGVVGLIQGVGGEPNCINSSVVNETTNHTDYMIIPVYDPPLFSVEVFFFLLFSMMCVSGMSFTLVHFLPQCRKERISTTMELSMENSEETVFPKNGKLHAEPNGQCGGRPPTTVAVRGYTAVADAASSTSDEGIMDRKVVTHNRDEDGIDNSVKQELGLAHFVYLLVLTTWINCLTNGLLPSIQSYSSLPYGNTAYTLAVRISTLANPIACLLALFVPCSSVIVLSAISACATGLSVYQIYLAAASPYPPLLGDISGDILVVVSAVLLVGLFSYAKVSLASMIRDSWGRKGLLWCGVVTQLGSFVGAIVAFILVNVQDVFHSAAPCS